MSADSGISRLAQAIRTARWVGAGLLMLAAGLLVLSLVVSLDRSVAPGNDTAAGRFTVSDLEPSDLAPLLDKLAGRALLRPLQIEAAVKDSGAAKELAKRLNLQGVVNVSDQFIAYIAVKDGGVAACKKGERVLEFLVEDIQPGKVTLSLEGVQVVLGR